MKENYTYKIKTIYGTTYIIDATSITEAKIKLKMLYEIFEYEIEDWDYIY